MSYTKAVTIWCDGDDCNEWHDGQGYASIGDTSSVAGARRNGRAFGWAYRGGRDLCPDCAQDQPDRSE